MKNVTLVVMAAAVESLLVSAWLIPSLPTAIADKIGVSSSEDCKGDAFETEITLQRREGSQNRYRTGV